jgi:hypothetical protein
MCNLCAALDARSPHCRRPVPCKGRPEHVGPSALPDGSRPREGGQKPRCCLNSGPYLPPFWMYIPTSCICRMNASSANCVRIPSVGSKPIIGPVLLDTRV